MRPSFFNIILVSLFFFVKIQVHAQCNISAGIERNGNGCTNVGSLYLSGADSATQIIWYKDGIPVHTTPRTAAPDSGITVAGGSYGIAPHQLKQPWGIMLDDSGYIYVSDKSDLSVKRFAPGSLAGAWGTKISGTTLNGGDPVGSLTGLWVDCRRRVFAADVTNQSVNDFSRHLAVIGDQGTGSNSSQLYQPEGIFMTCEGDILVADRANHRIQKFGGWSKYLNTLGSLHPLGVTIAGNGTAGSAANQLTSPCGVWQLPNGDLLVADTNNDRVQKFPQGSYVNTPAVTIIGNGAGSALNQVNRPHSICADAAGNIYVTDEGNTRVLKFPPNVVQGMNGTVVAGGNGSGRAANQFAQPKGLHVDWHGNVYIADAGNFRIQMWRPNGWIDTLYSPSAPGIYTAEITFANGCVQTSTPFNLAANLTPSVSISVNARTICPRGNAIFRAVPIAGGCSPAYQWYVNGIAKGINADTFSIRNLLTDNDTVWVEMTGNSAFATAGIVQSNKIVVDLEEFSPLSVIHLGDGCAARDTIAVTGASLASKLVWFGGYTRTIVAERAETVIGKGTGILNQVPWPEDIFIDSSGYAYVSDNWGRVICFPPGSKAGTNGKVVAGGSALTSFSTPIGVFVANDGYLYVADKNGNRVYRFPPGSDSTTRGIVVAGTTRSGSAANQLYRPNGVWVDKNGYLYVADALNHRVQKFPPGSDSTTNAETVAGGNGSGSAPNQLNTPYRICLDAADNLYITDSENSRVQKFPAGSTSATNGTTVAGGMGEGSAPYQLYEPEGITLGRSGEIYVADVQNHRVIRFPANSAKGTAGEIVAGGNGFGPYNSTLYYPRAVAVDSSKNVFVCDWINNRVQKWYPGTIIDTTLASLYPGNYYVQRTTANGCKDTAGFVTLNANVVPTVTVNSNTGGNLCVNTMVTFTATAIYGGSHPSYQWYKNGVAVGSDSAVYSSGGFISGDSVWVKLTSNFACAVPQQVNSLKTVMYTQGSVDTVTADICPNSVYIFRGRSLTTPGWYADTIISPSGCDSIINLSLSVLTVLYDTTYAAICSGNTYTFNSSVLSVAGLYTDTLTSISGCDSISVLVLTVDSIVQHTINATICAGDSFLLGTNYYNVTGTYIDTFLSHTGCDSVVMLQLQVNINAAGNISGVICDGDSYYFNNQNLANAGTYTDTLSGSNGCDSIIVLNLSILPVLLDTTYVTICSGSTYSFNSTVLSAAGVYTDTLTGINGCDSVSVLMLGVDSIIQCAITATICAGDSFLLGVNYYSLTGIYTDTFLSHSGCDSVVTLQLQVNTNATSNITHMICAGDRYYFNDQNLISAGTYNDTLTGDNGCDSIVTLLLRVEHLPDVTFSFGLDTVCDSTLSIPLSNGFPAGGVYSGDGTNGIDFLPATTFSGKNFITYYYQDSLGCSNTATDSIEVVSCFTDSCNALFAIFPDSLQGVYYGFNLSSGNNLSYMWYFGDGDSSSLDYPSHSYLQPGQYNVCLMVNSAAGCTDIYCDSSFYVFKTEGGLMSQLNIVASPTSINKVSDHDKVFLWPNPTNHYLHIGSGASPVQQIRCFDAFGKLVSDVKQPSYNTIDITNLAAGIYVAEIKVNNTFQRLKWVKM